MNKTLTPYQLEKTISILKTKRIILSKVQKGVSSMQGYEDRSIFLQGEINDINEIISVLEERKAN